MIASVIYIDNIKDFEISYKIHKFSYKSDKYWRSYSGFSVDDIVGSENYSRRVFFEKNGLDTLFVTR